MIALINQWVQRFHIPIKNFYWNDKSKFMFHIFSKIIENFPEAGNMLLDVNNYFNKIEKISNYLFFYMIVFEKLYIDKYDFVFNREHYDNISEKVINLIQHISS